MTQNQVNMEGPRCLSRPGPNSPGLQVFGVEEDEESVTDLLVRNLYELAFRRIRFPHYFIFLLIFLSL